MDILTVPLNQDQLDAFPDGQLEVIVSIDLDELITFNREGVVDILVNRVTEHPYNIYDIEYRIAGHENNTVFMKVLATVDNLE